MGSKTDTNTSKGKNHSITEEELATGNSEGMLPNLDIIQINLSVPAEPIHIAGQAMEDFPGSQGSDLLMEEPFCQQGLGEVMLKETQEMEVSVTQEEEGAIPTKIVVHTAEGASLMQEEK